tara:strand:+ start:558 stop:3149 length:2592 start_codon:yes stop_codon:yes gene_type:complete
MATAPKISNLPAAPNRQQPASFTPKGDALLSALPGFVSETNAVADYVEGAAGQVAIDKAAVDANVPLLNDAKAAAPLALQYRDTAKGYKESAAASKALAQQYKEDAASAVVYQDLASIALTKNITMVAGDIDTSPNPPISVQQRTSWFAELGPLPVRKILIAEADRLVLYNGDDPACPEWAVWDRAKGKHFYGSVDKHQVKMVSGVIYLGSVGAGYLKVFDLPRDDAYLLGTSGKFAYPKPQIVFRNVPSSASGQYVQAEPKIISNALNCLDARVYPWAQVDPVSGLQIATVAVGTDGGISILNGPAGAGTIVHIFHSSATTITSISLNEDGSLFYTTDNGAGGRYVHGRTSLPLVTEARGTGGNVSGSELFFHSIGSVDYVGQSGKLLNGNANLLADGVIANGGGLTFLRPNQVNPDETLRAFLDTDHNTGWMAKGCEGVWFCDTDPSSLDGANQYPNGDFASTDLSAYTLYGVTASVEGGRLALTSTASTGAVSARIVLPTVVGQTYQFSADVEADAANGVAMSARVQQSGNNSSRKVVSANGVVERLSFSFKAISATVTFDIDIASNTQYGGVGDKAYFDNMVLVSADEDRSGKGNHAPVGGILTRTPMGNSDAVGYAGAGFVEVPTELTQVGLDDFCLTGVVEITSNATQHIFGQSIKDTSVVNWTYDNVLYVGLEYMGSGNHRLALNLSRIDGSGYRVAYHAFGTNALFKIGQVLAFCVVRKGGICKIMVNGLEIATSTPAPAVDVQPIKTAYIREALAETLVTGQPMRDIKWHKGHAPSNEELREIARVDLAKQNGPTTMRGVVKNVYTLTKDKVTGLVHVGNNGGRSTFAFPLLVDESSDAATNAIVAHDGMILEN